MKNKILIVQAPYYAEIAKALLAGAEAKIKEAGFQYDIVTVPGALEIPAAIAMADKARYVGYVALGCIIRGETYHFEIVANESARGLMQLAITEKLAIGNGILTVNNEEQALSRANKDKLDKGGAAASACLNLLDVKHNFYAK